MVFVLNHIRPSTELKHHPVKGPQLLDEPIVEFLIPLASEELDNRFPTGKELRPIPPLAAGRVCQRNSLWIPGIPGILSHANLLCCRFCIERWKWWSWLFVFTHLNSLKLIWRFFPQPRHNDFRWVAAPECIVGSLTGTRTAACRPQACHRLGGQPCHSLARSTSEWMCIKSPSRSPMSPKTMGQKSFPSAQSEHGNVISTS